MFTLLAGVLYSIKVNIRVLIALGKLTHLRLKLPKAAERCREILNYFLVNNVGGVTSCSAWLLANFSLLM